MDSYQIFMLSLPIVFMIHDFEEIILFEPWIRKNGATIGNRFPKFARIFAYLYNVSTAKFACGVAVIFIILSAITFAAVVFEYYQIWMAVFMAFSLHLLMHIGQAIAVRAYVPSLATSILFLPYAIWGFTLILEMFTAVQIILWTLVGIFLAAFCLALVYRFILKYK